MTSTPDSSESRATRRVFRTVPDPDLPPRQRLVVGNMLPMFGNRPLAGASTTGPDRIDITCERNPVTSFDLSLLESLGRSENTADFHCVTTWSVRNLNWTGTPLRDVLQWAGLTRADGDYIVVRAADRRSGHFIWDDATADDVLLATHLNGEPLAERHGGPVRLVAPRHYGYKSIKYVSRIDVRSERPDQLGKEHLRGRVEHEERHPTLPNWVVRRPYRAVAPLVVALMNRTSSPYTDRKAKMTTITDSGGRIDTADHADPDWHVHEVASDFELIDAWRLPVSGSYDEFPELTKLFIALDFSNDEGSKANNLLFAVRSKMGELLGWDEEVLTLPIPGCDETSLRDRLTSELRSTADRVDDSTTDFQTVYQTNTEALLELSNSTVHAAVHLAWIAADDGSYVGQMGIYVKHRGTLGRIYMPAIAPFRHHIVYPAIMRRLGAAWQQRHL